jgi:hypothetical protein
VLGVVGVHMHLVEVLLMSSLDLCPFSVDIGADLDQGLLGDSSLLLPRDEGLLPPSQLHIVCNNHGTGRVTTLHPRDMGSFPLC